MDKERIRYLLQQYYNSKASKEETDELFGLIESEEGQEVLASFILEEGRSGESLTFPPGEDWGAIWAGIHARTISRPKVRVLSMRWARVAAAVILLAVAGAGYWVYSKERSRAPLAQTGNHFSNDITPGGQKAVLTLANGSTIILDSAHTGTLAQQGNTSILKVDTGALAYNTKDKTGGEVLYNTLTTPAGGQYQVVLPDGSKVWLNAASSLRFPTAFVGKERLVELQGEAYFEITDNASMPFHVKVPVGNERNAMDVKVLGTHFNIMAYANEQSIRTTLVEGAVKVSLPASGDNRREVKLTPGLEAVADPRKGEMIVDEANVEQAIAWKNGQFRFRETNIRDLMRQVERWYNVEVEYQTEGKDQDYTGVVPRNKNVSALLQTLELTGTVHFRIEGRKIIVLP